MKPNEQHHPQVVRGKQLPEVKDFKYLQDLFTSDDKKNHEIEHVMSGCEDRAKLLQNAEFTGHSKKIPCRLKTLGVRIIQQDVESA